MMFSALGSQCSSHKEDWAVTEGCGEGTQAAQRPSPVSCPPGSVGLHLIPTAPCPSPIPLARPEPLGLLVQQDWVLHKSESCQRSTDYLP